MVISRREITRAQPRARDGGEWSITRVWLPEELGRVPLVHVEVSGPGGLRMLLAVARLRGGRLEVRPPRAPDGRGEGVFLPPETRDRLRDRVLEAAQADPEARRVLRPYG